MMESGKLSYFQVILIATHATTIEVQVFALASDAHQFGHLSLRYLATARFYLVLGQCK